MTRRGWWLFAVLAVLWGIPYLLIKVAVRDFTPAALVFSRTAMGSLLLLPLAARSGGFRGLLDRWPYVVAFAFVEIGLPWFLLTDAERHISSSLAGLLIAAVPLAGALMARLVGHAERLEARRLVGLGVGFSGVLALLGFDVGRGDLVAVLEMVVVVLCYAGGPLIVTRKLSHLPSLAVITASFGLCALAYAPFAIPQLPRVLPPAASVASVAALSVFCTGLAFITFFKLLAEVGPIRATVVTYLNPAVAVALGVTLLGEPFTVGTAIGFTLILCGSFLATRPVGVRAARPGRLASQDRSA